MFGRLSSRGTGWRAERRCATFGAMNPRAGFGRRFAAGGAGRRAVVIVAVTVAVWGLLAAVRHSATRAATPPPLHVPRAAVASDNAEASAAGVAALKAGGNAVDAACATALALGVVHPFASGMGGGGFALVYLARERRVVALDFRETAPAGIKADMFLVGGKADPKRSREGGLAVAVPGEVRGLGALVKRYGKLPFARCVAPAEKLARGGARVSWRLAEVLAKEPIKAPAKEEAAFETVVARLFPGGKSLRQGDTFRRPDLAWTLARLRSGGPDAFYRGEIADEIVRAVHDAGGVMTKDDLAGYAPKDRTPLETTYRGLRVASMPPPSSGGVALAETLGILAARQPDAAEATKAGRGSSAALHVLTEAMKHAFADRARHLGDPDFVKVPTDRLLAPAYHAELARRIKDGAIGPSDSYGTPDAPADLHRDGGTAHLSVVDADGNAVALTTTVNLGFGAKLVAGKTGVVLNDQMDDFAMQPGVPNGFGLIGSAQNAVAPGKRPLSSMTPTIVLDGDGVRLVLGAAGGPTIISATTQVLLNVVDWKLDAQEAIAAPRIHHQWFPEILMTEPELAPDVTDALTKRGHKVREIPHIGVSNLIVRRPDGSLEAAAEPRSPSTPAGY
jgi:gamma-glutamyltranspeptidase / glutathione hydrolase